MNEITMFSSGGEGGRQSAPTVNAAWKAGKTLDRAFRRRLAECGSELNATAASQAGGPEWLKPRIGAHRVNLEHFQSGSSPARAPAPGRSS